MMSVSFIWIIYYNLKVISKPSMMRKSSTLGWLDSEESSSSDENEVEASDQQYFETMLTENLEQQK